MKRMNLLPPEVRPREGGRRGASYFVIGGLVASVLAMLAYAIVIGGVHSDESELASLKDETRTAQAQAEALRPYGEFAEMKQQRERSVRTVAETRFNYERLTRELARILPAGVWVGHMAVAPAEPEDSVVDAGADSAVATQPLAPAMTISGCAPSQDVVADTLDRLRALTTATNVELGSSSQTTDDASAPTSSSSSSSDKPYLVSGSGATDGCNRSGRPRVAFDATVTLTAPVGEQVAQPATTPTATTGDGS
jgi:Tfp pilus assembly protein PilN